MAGYAELQITTNFSFLRGASHPEELVERAQMLGLAALAVTDRNSLAGVVRAHVAAKTAGLRLVIGARLDLVEGRSLLCFPRDRAAYGRLCRLLSRGKLRAEKGGCELALPDLSEAAEGQILIALGDHPDDGFRDWLLSLKEACGAGDLFLAMTRRFRPREQERLEALDRLGQDLAIPRVVTNDVLYHRPERRILQDLVSAIREGCTLDELGYRRERSADRFLKPPEEMCRLFCSYPEALERSLEIIEKARFSLDEIAFQYPEERPIEGLSAQDALKALTWEGAAKRYHGSPPPQVRTQLDHELSVIAELGYAPYFLTVWRIVEFARSQGILCQGRGSAANSAVCFCLGITAIDPAQRGLLFERFISTARNEPPDIDVDFEHERREEVIQWIYQTYGRERAAMTAVVSRYRTRGALREVGKVLGLSEDVTSALVGSIWGWSVESIDEAAVRKLGFDPRDWRLHLTLTLSRQLIGFPRHLSQHPGGFVLTQDRLDALVPLGNAAMAERTMIEWDKDDLDTLGFMKVDILGLGMLGCLRRGFDLLKAHKGQEWEVATIPTDDRAMYDMLSRADSIGVFQVESRAQMNMLPRLQPKTFYDLVIEVAIVRPGPIQGDMVHPYLQRRQRGEAVRYPSPALEKVLERTLGVPLFQEQAMQIAIVGAGFTADEADQLRRAMATFRKDGHVERFRKRFLEGMAKNGLDRDFAERCFKQIEGFGTYGFPESHAASFAILVVASAWMKCHHPEVFCAALLNAQPMGFYAPAQLVRDAREHGVEVRPPDVNSSRWDCTLEETGKALLAVRLGLRMAAGFSEESAARLVAARHQSYENLEDLWRRSGLPVTEIERLAEADAFGSLGLDRRQALWAAKALKAAPLSLFAAADRAEGRHAPELREPEVALVPMSAGGEVVEDYATLSLSLRDHPLRFLRADLRERGLSSLASLKRSRDGDTVHLAGLVLVRQRPGSAKGVVFITVEDEGGTANLVVWPKLFQTLRAVVLTAQLLGIQGRVQREGEIIHVIAERLEDLTPLLARVARRDHAFPARYGRRDGAGHDGAEARDKTLLPPARDIYVADAGLDGEGAGLKTKSRDFK